MKSEKPKSSKEEQSGRKGKISASKRKMIERAKNWKPNSSPDLREAYSSKIEWVQKAIPKSKKEA